MGSEPRRGECDPAQVLRVAALEPGRLFPRGASGGQRRPADRRRDQGPVRLEQTHRSESAGRRPAPSAVTPDVPASEPIPGARPGADIHVALRGIAHIYPARAGQGPVEALGPLDLEFRRGEFVAVVGPSGCGKSTLLEVIAGLVVPSAGQVEMERRTVTGTVADGMGVVFQADATFARLHVWD